MPGLKWALLMKYLRANLPNEPFMKKEAAKNLELETEHRDMTKLEARLVLYGISAAMASMATINNEVINARDDAVDMLNEGKENEKPPKPPRQPNAPAHLALGNT
jgi:hypothetical protein